MSGVEEIRNLLYDPLPTGSGSWSMDNTHTTGKPGTFQFRNGQLAVAGAGDTNNSYVVRHLPDTPAGEYVFSLNALSGSNPTMSNNRLVQVMNTTWHQFGTIPASALNTRAVFRFSNPTQQRVILTFQAPVNEARVAYERMLLCTADDYARLQQLGVNWFSGDTYTTG